MKLLAIRTQQAIGFLIIGMTWSIILFVHWWLIGHIVALITRDIHWQLLQNELIQWIYSQFVNVETSFVILFFIITCSTFWNYKLPENSCFLCIQYGKYGTDVAFWKSEHLVVRAAYESDSGDVMNVSTLEIVKSCLSDLGRSGDSQCMPYF